MVTILSMTLRIDNVVERRAAGKAHLLADTSA
jgi:hypothetical protein